MQLWRINEEDLSPVDLVTFESEKELQDLIEKNPEIIPIDAELMILAREFQCGSGIADFVAVDMQTGQLVIVETKLYRNKDRRRVVAQALDYAADMFDQELEYLEQRVSSSIWSSLDRAAKDVLADSLRSGDFRLVIVMDSVDERTRKVARYFQGAGVRFQIELVTITMASVDGAPCIMTALNEAGARPEDASTTPPKKHRRVARTDARIAEAVDLRAQGFLLREIAERFEMSEPTISRWLNGRS